MKVKLFVLFSLFLFTIPLFAQVEDTVEPDHVVTIEIGQERAVLHDSLTNKYALSQFKERKIKSEREETYLAEIVGDSIKKLYRKDLAYLDFDLYQEYDILKRSIKAIRYNDGTPFLNEYSKTIYDEQGNGKVYRCSLETDECEHFQNLIYKNDNLVESSYLNEQEILSKTIYKYNENNQLVERINIDIEDGKEVEGKRSQSFYTYDYRGDLIHYKHQYSNDWQDSVTTFEYDDHGNVISEEEGNVYPEFKDSNVSIKRSYKYLFDEYGNWITKFISVNDGELYFITERIIDYY